MSAWKRLLTDRDWCRGRGHFPLPAYSEMLPPPWLGPKPYDGQVAGLPPPRADDFGWNVSEYQQGLELGPALDHVAGIVLAEMMRLGRGQTPHYLGRHKLHRNPAWPAALAAQAGQLAHERYVLLLGVALSRTQDDKGRVRWTLFGSCEQGPGKAFWRGFFTAPGVEVPWSAAQALFAELLVRAHGIDEQKARDPAAAGVHILPTGRDPDFPYWNEGPLPSWCESLRYRSLEGVQYLLTFRPFERLPAEVQEAYLAGRLHLWPFPGSLVFWYVPGICKLQKQLPFAAQVPLLFLFSRRNLGEGLRVPQSGRHNEKVAALPGDAPHSVRSSVPRTHRWQKVRRHEEEVNAEVRFDPLARALFSSHPDDIELYNKPMARQVQLWTADFRLVLDGLRARRPSIERAAKRLARGGHFGYRFVWPAMRVGAWQVYWQRPVCAFADGEQPVILSHAPTGYLTAYHARKPNLARPVELWPRFLDRPAQRAAVELFRHESEPRRGHTTENVRVLLDWRELLDQPLPRSLARALLAIPHKQRLDDWLASLPGKAGDATAAKALVAQLRTNLTDDDAPPAPLTFEATATRTFEEDYWRTIGFLAHGRFRTKCNADCVRDKPTRQALPTRRRELDLLADYLVARYQEIIAEAGVSGAWAGEHRFSWRTDFEFPWMGGWARNQEKRQQERNIVVRIPGRDHRQAVIMADHYDTAYMHDRYYLSEGGTGARLAAAGADDNHSATAMLLLAAPLLLGLSKAGRLGCDVWLVHLTGEEFPSDCLGARHLTQALVERTLRVKEPGGPLHDLSGVRVRGLYVSDMIAHNNDRERSVFQISPGSGQASARLALAAHRVNEGWNALARSLNRSPPRKGAAPFRRQDDPDTVPAIAPHAVLRGEVRPEWQPRSTLFNTDGQVFSDAGIPCVLFMEDYDIDRCGYHDSHDTMANIDLDYGAALAAIVIETVARVAQ